MNDAIRTQSEAARYVGAIQANVDAMYDDRITFEEFGENQRRLWTQIARNDTTHHNVLALLRNDPGDLI